METSARRQFPAVPALLQILAMLLAMGCGRQPAGPPSEPAGRKPSVVVLKIQVFGDEEIAGGIKLLRGEWEALGEGLLEVESLPLNAADKSGAFSGDVAVFPSRYLGAFAERGELQPIRNSILDSPELALADIYPVVRTHEIRYGNSILALPLGAPPLMICAGPSNGPNQRLIPLAGTDAAHAFLLRVVTLVDNNSRAELLFDSEEFRPRLAAPPFVRALTQLVGELQNTLSGAPLSIAECVTRVRKGRAVQTIGWPGIGRSNDHEGQPLRFELSPPAEDVYSFTQRAWRKELNDSPVTYLGVEGRIVAVSSGTRNAMSAMKFCQLLSTGDTAVRISSRSVATLWFRASQASRSSEWAGRTGANEGENVRAAASALESDSVFQVPRIPGADEYLATLAVAVRKAISGAESPEDALQAAVRHWEDITERLGRAKQLGAYRLHLGLDSI